MVECTVSGGYAKTPKLDAYQVEIAALLKNGATKTWIAKKYGTTRRNLNHWMKQHQIAAEPGD
jgi:transcriptional regulator